MFLQECMHDVVRLETDTQDYTLTFCTSSSLSTLIGAATAAPSTLRGIPAELRPATLDSSTVVQSRCNGR